MPARLISGLMFGLLAVDWHGCGARVRPPPKTASAGEVAEGWVLLFDGESLFGWQPGCKAIGRWSTARSGSRRGTGLLCTTSPFADFALKVDFRADKGTNSGVFSARRSATPTWPPTPTS